MPLTPPWERSRDSAGTTAGRTCPREVELTWLIVCENNHTSSALPIMVHWCSTKWLPFLLFFGFCKVFFRNYGYSCDTCDCVCLFASSARCSGEATRRQLSHDLCWPPGETHSPASQILPSCHHWTGPCTIPLATHVYIIMKGE